MSASLEETMADLRALLSDVRHAAEDVGYGFFPGGDPRTFSPDPECSTEAEREAHRIDCERFGRGERTLTETRCQHTCTDTGAMIVTPSGYGLGTYTMEDPFAKDVAERLERAIDQLQRIIDDNG